MDLLLIIDKKEKGEGERIIKIKIINIEVINY